MTDHTSNTAKQIQKALITAGGLMMVRDLIKAFGEQTSEALDLLTARKAIIRVRGVGAHVEIA